MIPHNLQIPVPLLQTIPRNRFFRSIGRLRSDLDISSIKTSSRRIPSLDIVWRLDILVFSRARAPVRSLLRGLLGACLRSAIGHRGFLAKTDIHICTPPKIALKSQTRA